MRMDQTVYMMTILSLLVLVSGCVNNKQEPPDYSAGYSYVATGSSSEKGVNGSVLAPDACLAEPAEATPPDAATDLTVVSDLGSHLPSGCANAYNLQRMVERERDLVEGRRMGAAPAAPTTRAARRYLYGEGAAIGTQIDAGEQATTSQ